MQSVLEVITALTAAKVDYVVVGGMAVVAHGHPRMTVDLDVALALDQENLGRALAVLQNLGLIARLPAAPTDLLDADTREKWIREKNLIAFPMHDPQNVLREVDLIVNLPFPYDELAAHREVVAVLGVPMPVASLADLIRLKRASDRDIDRSDLAVLEAIAQGSPNAAN